MAELDIQRILERLAASGVDFIVIGGVAVGFHGYIRATKDLDVVPAPDPPNLTRLASMLRELGAELDGAADFDEAELPDPLDPEILAEGGNWVLQTMLGRLDLMQWQGDQELWGLLSPAAVTIDLDGTILKVAGYDDLVAMKEQAGRPGDLEDLERLRQARGDEPR